MTPTKKTPTLFLPHGGGPCFFMDWNPPDTWTGMAKFLKEIPATIETPKAIVVISGHWEQKEFSITGSANPPLIYDYQGFPPHTYQLKYNAPGSPALAAQIADQLRQANLPARIDPTRGFDHGVFIPFKVIYPEAHIPIVQLSLQSGLDPATHLAAGRALAQLRKENVLIVGSGMSYHNLRAFGEQFTKPSEEFDAWLTSAVTNTNADERNELLKQWSTAPHARLAHSREEHLIPLLVAAGAAGGDQAQRVFTGHVMGVQVSAYRFG